MTRLVDFHSKAAVTAIPLRSATYSHRSFFGVLVRTFVDGLISACVVGRGDFLILVYWFTRLRRSSTRICLSKSVTSILRLGTFLEASGAVSWGWRGTSSAWVSNAETSMNGKGDARADWMMISYREGQIQIMQVREVHSLAYKHESKLRR